MLTNVVKLGKYSKLILNIRKRYDEDDTEIFIKAAVSAVESMYKVETPYAKAGIMLFDLISEFNVQGSLQETDQKRTAL